MRRRDGKRERLSEKEEVREEVGPVAGLGASALAHFRGEGGVAWWTEEKSGYGDGGGEEDDEGGGGDGCKVHITLSSGHLYFLLVVGMV